MGETKRTRQEGTIQIAGERSTREFESTDLLSDISYRADAADPFSDSILLKTRDEEVENDELVEDDTRDDADEGPLTNYS